MSSGVRKVFIQVQYPCDTSGIIGSHRLDDLLEQLAGVKHSKVLSSMSIIVCMYWELQF